MTTYLRLIYTQLLPDLLHSNARGNVCQELAKSVCCTMMVKLRPSQLHGAGRRNPTL
jgi:hypothetical protein